jgi:shikimate kinase/3-dehydroquinate synthase
LAIKRTKDERRLGDESAEMNLVLYGPPGSGKTTVGRIAARQLGRQFVDGDSWIEARWGRPVADYFSAGDETLFRSREAEAYRSLAAQDGLVVAPGGGALSNPHLRAALECTGVLVCLTATFDTLVGRLERGKTLRPLLAGDLRGKLAALLREREPLYRSFPIRVPTDGLAPDLVAAEAVNRFQAASRYTRFELGPTSALYGSGLFADLPALLADSGLRQPFVVIADDAVAALHGAAVHQVLGAPVISFPAGEANKNLATVQVLYGQCLQAGLERGGAIVVLGGGVAGDMAGFVAATFMRGVAWANLPTSVLAMADAGLGGKVGVDLPEGKNLVGAFHPPALVIADFDVLKTLPEIEVRCGLAEIIKAGLVRDAALFEDLESGSLTLEVALVRAAAVKVGVVNADPYERGERASLNLGHTIGHGLEAASGYRLRHGEAVAIGLVGESRLAERLGLAEQGLAERVAGSLRQVGLPDRAPGMAPAGIRSAMGTDKKKIGGKIKFALPRCPGQVEWGLEVGEPDLMAVLEELTRVK